MAKVDLETLKKDQTRYQEKILQDAGMGKIDGYEATRLMLKGIHDDLVFVATHSTDIEQLSHALIRVAGQSYRSALQNVNEAEKKGE